MAVPIEGCDAAQAARTVARLLQPNAWEKRLRLSVNVAAGLPRVACDPRLLRRVLLKIAGNAIKFTERGNVEIALDAKRDAAGRSCVRFSITDTGPGIPTHMQSAIFDSFTRLSTNPADTPHGAGVGLSVAKSLVESVGGNIGVDSEPGMGASFWVMIPVTEAPATSQPDNIESAAPPVALQLLVLARDPAMRATIDRTLTPFGNRITFAENLGQASTISARNTFDAILSTAGHVDSLVGHAVSPHADLGARRVGRTAADRREPCAALARDRRCALRGDRNHHWRAKRQGEGPEQAGAR